MFFQQPSAAQQQEGLQEVSAQGDSVIGGLDTGEDECVSVPSGVQLNYEQRVSGSYGEFSIFHTFSGLSPTSWF